MGLDMNLLGVKFYWTDWKEPENNVTEDGFRLQEKTLELGYWRKHPDLHGFIVQEFTDGVDDCRRIELTVEDVQKIIEAAKGKALPHTAGFFFGKSTTEKDEATIPILEKAIEWANGSDGESQQVSRAIVYEASW